MQNVAANAYPFNSGLGLKTSAYDKSGTIKVAELDSVRQDILYGTFRMRATIPSVRAAPYPKKTQSQYYKARNVGIAD